MSYTFFPTGKVETITSSNASGVSVAYSYDDLNRLQTVTDNRLTGNQTTTYAYDSGVPVDRSSSTGWDDASNVATVQIPNGLTSTFTYDSLNRLTELSTPPVADYRYTLGATGIRTNATEQSGRTLVWNYDNIYRLNGETVTGDPGNNNGTVDYTLDPVGNRTGTNSTFSSLSPGFGTYNADDQVSNESYDPNGNTTRTANGNTFTYDSENHMTSMTGNGKVVTMKYDAFGNRVSKTVNGVTTLYLVEDDVNPTGYPQVLEEVQNGAAVRTYTYGLQRISEDQVINGAWTPSFYGYDGFGTVRQLTNSAGTVTDTYEYDAYGNFFTKTGTTPNNYLYRGEQFDTDLGLYYLRARYYNPATGRFMSRDPKAGNRFDPASLHRYLYASGDPINKIDPRGRADLLETGALTLRSVIAGTIILNTISCGASLGFAYAVGMLFEESPNAGDYFFMSAGCLTMTFNPDTSKIPGAKTVVAPVLNWIGVAGCAWGMVEMLQAMQASLNDPDNVELEQKVDIATMSSLTGCVVPLIAVLIAP